MAQKLKPQKVINTLEYLNLKSVEDDSLAFLKKEEKVVENIDKSIEKSYNEMNEYNHMFQKMYEQEYRSRHPEEYFSSEEEFTYDGFEKDRDETAALSNLKLTVAEHDVVKKSEHLNPFDPEHLNPIEAIEHIVDKTAQESIKKHNNDNLSNSYQVNESIKEDLEKIMKENNVYYFKDCVVESPKKIDFEKTKFLKASWFMKIGHYIGLSLRNQYYERFDNEIIKAINNNEIYKVLEAQKNGYYLGKKLNKITISKLYENLINSPSSLLEQLVQRDILLSHDYLSIIIFSKEGKELINNEVKEYYPYAKTLIQDLLKKENFLFANKNLWLNSLKDKDLFLTENNPLFYHEKMLAICENSELLTVKKVLGDFLQEEDILKSISKNKLIDKMLLKVDFLLGNSIDLDHMILDLPQAAQNLYKSIKEINFKDGDIKILQEAHSFDYDLVEKRVPEAVIKYLNVDSNHRTSLKNQNGKTAENLLIETLENILVLKKDLNLFVNQVKIADLSVTRRYTDNIRGDIGKPSLFTLKTLQQLKESGELIDLSNEMIDEIASEKKEKKLTQEQLKVSPDLAERVKGVRINSEILTTKKLKI